MTHVYHPGKETERLMEQAYRRGVHQALAMLQYYAQEEGVSADVVLPDLVKIASDIRGARKAYPMLLHQLFNRVHRKRQRRKAGPNA